MPRIIPAAEAAAAREFSFTDLEAEGRRVVAEAKARAARIIASAQEAAYKLEQQQQETGFREGHERGVQEGRAAGEQQIRRELEQKLNEELRARADETMAALLQSAEIFELRQRKLIAAAETGLIQLALAVAERVCKFAAEADDAVARANARALLEMVQHRHDAELHLHPQDCQLLRSAQQQAAEKFAQFAHVHLIPDDGVTRGGAVLATPDGEIDARLETQLARVARALLGQAATDADSDEMVTEE